MLEPFFMELPESLLNQLMDLGFTIARVAPVAPPQHIAIYKQWIRAGMHGGMGYLAQAQSVEKRADPRLIMPEARAVLILGIPYYNPDSLEPPADTGIYGKVASYAWGMDYHSTIPPRLNQAARIIEEFVGRKVTTRGYTDTGPILERDFAQRAGLGWIGKNTCLIIPGRGSYFLLSELFLDVEIEPDFPFLPDQCGSCTRCIDSCPTACIRNDRTIDARRCISYLTIENKGEIAEDLRSALGNWIFGCDICQQVCPWNQRFAPPEGHPDFAPRPNLAQPELTGELALSVEEFNRKFKDNPIRRAKRRGYLRNITIALGNSRDPKAILSLENCLEHEVEPLVRQHAAWALGRIGTSAARSILERRYPTETSFPVQLEIVRALASF
jgi:epoxyqueuosine reductase